MRNLLRAMAAMALMITGTVTMWAQVWDGTVASAYAGGTGSKYHPYEIATPSQFALLLKQITDDQTQTYSKYYVLTADLVFNENLLNADGTLNTDVTPKACPMGGSFTNATTNKAFQGVLNGQGHKIIGYYIDKPTTMRCAPFACIKNATIKNLGIIDSYVCGMTNSSLLCAIALGTSRIVSCYTNSTLLGAMQTHGAFVGSAYNSTLIANCYNTGVVKATGSTNKFGSILGGIPTGTGFTVKVDNCYSSADMTGTDGTKYLAVVGSIMAMASKVYNCFAVKHADEMNESIVMSGTASFYTTTGSKVITPAELTGDEVIASLNENSKAIAGACLWKKGADGKPELDYSTSRHDDEVDKNRLATNPSPANGDTKAAADDGTVKLSWTAAADGLTATQYLYIADSQEALEAMTTPTAVLGTETEYTASGLTGLTYYWRVDQADAEGNTEQGDVWSFSARTLAFPGADGGGKYTTGGRGGAVYHVTNLNDSGEGSLRWALSRSGKRTIVFDVAGTIALNSTLGIGQGNVTVAGQTAPGDGICIKNYPLNISASNVIIRFIRCRMGDEKQTEDDAMNSFNNAMNYQNIIIDHCSISWSTDECASFYGVKDFSFQWNIVSESLTNSVHDKGLHGYGGIWGGQNAAFHHNLIADHNSRNPRFDHYYVNQQKGIIDYVNNVVYNWGSNNSYGGESSNKNALRYINFVNNYYKPGPASTRKDQFLELDNKDCSNCMKATGHESTVYPAALYLTGNIYEGNETLNADNWKGIIPKPYMSEEALALYKSSEPYEVTPIENTTSAETAFERVLDYAGASLRRDAVDARVVNDARTGTATIKDGGNGSKNGIIDTQAAVGGWPELKATDAEKAAVATDTNNNGIPDAREKELFGDLVDGNAFDKDPRMTNLEYYLAWLVRDITNGQSPVLLGDANEDGVVSVSDIVATASYILGNTPEKFNVIAADSNKDGIISVTDIVTDAQIILGN